MTRPSYSHDPVGDYVAYGFLPADIKQAINSLPARQRDLLLYIIDNPREDRNDRDERAISRLSGWIRLNPVHRERLLTYLGGRAPEGLCLWCGRELKPREPGKAGRPAKYCDPNHRQRACRARRSARARS